MKIISTCFAWIQISTKPCRRFSNSTEPKEILNWNTIMDLCTTSSNVDSGTPFYGAAGSANLDLLEKMYQNWVTKLSLGIDSNIVHRSILLGAKRGSRFTIFFLGLMDKMLLFSKIISKAIFLPQSPECGTYTSWLFSQSTLSISGTRTILTESISSVSLSKILAYSPDPNSIMYTEAFRAYQKSTNLSQAEGFAWLL